VLGRAGVVTVQTHEQAQKLSGDVEKSFFGVCNKFMLCKGKEVLHLFEIQPRTDNSFQYCTLVGVTLLLIYLAWHGVSVFQLDTEEGLTAFETLTNSIADEFTGKGVHGLYSWLQTVGCVDFSQFISPLLDSSQGGDNTEKQRQHEASILTLTLMQQCVTHCSLNVPRLVKPADSLAVFTERVKIYDVLLARNGDFLGEICTGFLQLLNSFIRDLQQGEFGVHELHRYSPLFYSGNNIK